MACVRQEEEGLPPCALCSQSVYLDEERATVSTLSLPLKLCKHSVYHRSCVRSQAASTGGKQTLHCNTCGASQVPEFVNHWHSVSIVWSWSCLFLCVAASTTLLAAPHRLSRRTTILLLAAMLSMWIHFGVHKWKRLPQMEEKRDSTLPALCSVFSWVLFDIVSSVLGMVLLLLQTVWSKKEPENTALVTSFVASLLLPLLYTLFLLIRHAPFWLQRLYYSCCCTELHLSQE